MHTLSVVVMTLNEERKLPACLESVKDIADEIVVVDSHSTDRTVEISKAYGCRVILHAFEGFSRQKRFAISQAACEWILSLDADEFITPELSREIAALKQMEVIPFDGYWLPVALRYLGREMKRGKIGREKKLKLFCASKGEIPEVSVHEEIVVKGKAGVLKGKMIHDSYRDLTHHLEKINYYTTHAAEGYVRRGKRFPTIWVAFKFPVSFITYYIFKGGILEGYQGFIWSFLAAVYGSMKIAKTIEKYHPN